MGETGEGDEEYTFCDEYWVVYRITESLWYTPETNITLYINCSGIRKKYIYGYLGYV